MPLTILGIGTAVPKHSIGREEAVRYITEYFSISEEETQRIKALYRMTGVKKRHSVLLRVPEGGTLEERQKFMPYPSNRPTGPPLSERMGEYEREAAPLAVASSKEALAESGVAPEQVTHLVTVSCSGFYAPGWDFRLMEVLGLSPTVARTHVGFMGCHGALNGLRVADSFAANDPDAVVLLCATELCSLHYHYSFEPEHLVSNALFADGSAALVGKGAHRHDNGVWRVHGTGSCLIPDSADGMSWRIRDHGFQMSLSPRVPSLIEGNLGPWVETWLQQYGYAIEDIRSWAIHPGGPKILTSSAKALGITIDDLPHSRAVLADYGNMSSPTILFIVERMRIADAPRPCVALAFGPGLVVEATLFA